MRTSASHARNLHVRNVPDEERAFYSKGTYDIEYDFPFGRQELEGVAYRTDYDLSQHQKASGKSLEYFDEETKERFIPHVVEPSAGVDRTVLAMICEAYAEDQAPNDKGRNGIAHRFTFSSADGADQMRNLSAAQKQGAARREGEGDRRRFCGRR